MRVSIIIVLWSDKLQPVIYISIRPTHPTAVSRNIMNRLSLGRQIIGMVSWVRLFAQATAQAPSFGKGLEITV